jgi:glycosyltransferase involved in cell wall biosynthesis
MPLEYNNKFKAALIVPAYNEEAVIGRMLAAAPGGLYELIVVSDNGSSDATADIAYNAGATVVSDEERGYGAACLRAISALPETIDAVVFMQADLSESYAEADLLLAPIRKGEADLVIGSRTLGLAEPGALLPHQKFGNDVASWMIRFLFRHRYTDLGPYRAIRADSLRDMGMEDRNYGWTVEMQVRALQQGLRVVEVPIHYGRRVAGENKVSGNLSASVKAGWKIVTTVLRLFVAK